MDCNQADTDVVQVAVGTVELDIAGTAVEEETAVAAECRHRDVLAALREVETHRLGKEVSYHRSVDVHDPAAAGP